MPQHGSHYIDSSTVPFHRRYFVSRLPEPTESLEQSPESEHRFRISVRPENEELERFLEEPVYPTRRGEQHIKYYGFAIYGALQIIICNNKYNNN